MTLFKKQKIVILIGVFLLALLGCGAYFFDVKVMMPKRTVVLPEIQFDAGKAANQSLSPLSGNLFGSLPDAEITLTETNLNLTLKGTVPAFDNEEGMAIIMVGRKDEQILHVGAEVLRGVVLDAVYEKHVVLRRSNAKEVLRFPNSDEEDKLLQLGSSAPLKGLAELDSEVTGHSFGLTVSH